jgi:hypothetical protein
MTEKVLTTNETLEIVKKSGLFIKKIDPSVIENVSITDHPVDVEKEQDDKEDAEKEAKKRYPKAEKVEVQEKQESKDALVEVLKKGGPGSGPQPSSKPHAIVNREKQTDQAKLTLKAAKEKVAKKEMSEDEYKRLEKELADSLKKSEKMDILDEICKELVKKQESTKDINELISEVESFQKSKDLENTINIKKSEIDSLVEELFKGSK